MRLSTFGQMAGVASLAACSPNTDRPAAAPADAIQVEPTASPQTDMPTPAAAATAPAPAPVQSAAPRTSEPQSAQSAQSAQTMSLAGWTGQWFGPEGLSLAIQPAGPGRVRINLKDSLDSSAQYIGDVNRDSISFERRGVTETLRRGTGSETGFSFLRSRKDCLIVRTNQEGYCRAAPAQPNTALASWVGRWQGPEGLFLDIQPGASPDQVRLTVKDNLDSQDRYIGRVSGSTIRFERRGKTETIRKGSGAETGFSFLRSRQDCVIVVAGQEGYCRPA